MNTVGPNCLSPVRMSYWVSLGSGLLMSFATAPLNIWIFAWFSLAPLWFWVTQPKRPLRSRLTHAALWGLAYHGLTLSWLFYLHPLTWMGIPWLTSAAITFTCWLVITLWGTAFVILWLVGLWLYERFCVPTHSAPWSASLQILVGTTLWCLLEAARNLSPLDWTPLAFTQSPGNLVILQLGQLSGPLTISAAIAAVNGCLAISYRHSRTVQRSQIGYGIALGLFLIAHGIGFLIDKLPLSSEPLHPPIKVGIIQGNIPTREKLFQAGIQKARDHYIQGYQQLADQGADLVITPEGAFPLRWQTQQPLVRDLLQVIRDRNVPLIIGTFMPKQGQITQSLIMLSGDGTLLSRYDKVRLVLFGEYIPKWMRGWLRRLSPVMGSLEPGEPNQVFQTPFGQSAVGICYESVFSELLRSQVVAGSSFLLIASNLDPYSTALMAQIHAHDVMRAVESDRDLVRVTNTGFSGLIQADGATQWLSEANVFVTKLVSLQPRHTQTLYLLWGNWLTPLLSLTCLALTLIFCQRDHRTGD